MSEDTKRKKIVKYAALAAAILALVCNSLPAQYQMVCHTIAAVCTAGH